MDAAYMMHETLGLAHNDINPFNIMLDDDGNAIIIDFDSCMPIGQDIRCRKAGTFGWEMDPVPSTSAPDNDMYGLKLIAKFMGHCWSARIDHSPLDVVAWHGNNAPYRYDLRRFNTIGSISYDHPDPSIFPSSIRASVG